MIRQVEGRGQPEVRRLASLQRGNVVREQLIAAGIGRGAIGHRLAVGSLAVMFRGVYLVGHDALAPFAREMAAALSYRGWGVLSHRSAAAVWKLIPEPPSQIDLTVVGRDVRSRPELRIITTKVLHPRDFRWRDGLPVTSPARTMIDLAGCVDADLEVERALAELRVLGLARDSELRAAMDRCPHRKGVARVRALMNSEQAPALTRSEAERRMLALCERAGLPRPVVGARPCGFPVDFLWPPARLVVEVDGLTFHGHRRAFENDRRRDQILVAAGYRVIRVTWRQITHEPLAVIARLAQALAIGR